MTWQLTGSLAEFENAAGPLLQAGPARHTVPLSVLDSLRHAGLSRFGAAPPVFGWHRGPDGTPDGAVLQTPPYPLLIAVLPPGSAAGLLAALSRPALPGAANLAVRDEPELAAAWAALTGGTLTAGRRSRLYQLGRLTPPDPPPGAARTAGAADRDLLIGWHEAFAAEVHEGAGRLNAERAVDERLGYGGLLLWEAAGEPAALAALTPAAAGVARVTTVYTLPGCRGRGYGGAVTAAASRAALAAGASAVVLFTDLANATSNALYQRLGYRPVEDRMEAALTAPGPAR